MQFSYGSLYGMTGILALFSDVQAFSKALQIGNLNLNTKTYLLNLYDELLALQKIFSSDNTDGDLPHVIVSVDSDSQQAKAFLRGYNNYLNYLVESKKLEMAIESADFTDTKLDSVMSTIDDINGTSIFNDSVDLSLDDLDLNSNSLSLDDQLNLDVDIAEDETTLVRESKTLLTTYEQVLNTNTNIVDLVAWGNLYQAAETSEDTYESLTWGQAMRKLKADATGKTLAVAKQGLMGLEVSEEVSREFLKQREQLPKVIVSYEVSTELSKIIRKAAGLTTQISDVDNKNILSFLREIQYRISEPAMLSLGSEQQPKLKLLIDLVQQAIMTSGSSKKYIGVDIADLQTWNSSSESSIIWRVNNQMANIINSNLSEKQLDNLITECNTMLGDEQDTSFIALTDDEIDYLSSSQGQSIEYIKDIILSKFYIQASLADDVTEFIINILKLSDYEQSRRKLLRSLMSSRDMLLFVFYLHKAVTTAETNLTNTLKNIFSDNDNDIENYNSFFRQFTLNTGICGCCLNASVRMFTMLQQLGSALLKTQEVAFSREKPAYEIVSMIRVNLQSMKDRLINEQRR